MHYTHAYLAQLMRCCASQDILKAALDLVSGASSNSDRSEADEELATCILQRMVQPPGEQPLCTANCRQLADERPFWQQRIFSMAANAIVQVICSSGNDSARGCMTFAASLYVGSGAQVLAHARIQHIRLETAHTGTLANARGCVSL